MSIRAKASPWLVVLLPISVAMACSSSDGGSGGTEESLGRIESTMDEAAKTIWPGNVRQNGERYVRLLNGFFDGEASAYWFAGFASRITADVFWFCPEGDELCPLDQNGVIDRGRTVGDPVFARIPGESGFSPFWLIWVVRVPSDYEANSLKSQFGIEKAAEAGKVQLDRVVFDHGGDVGPDLALMHCLLLLEGTELERNGEDIVGRPGVPSRYVPVETGWHKQYQLSFADFTLNSGVFPPAPESESVPMMPTADIFVFFRDCDNGSSTELCRGLEGFDGAVSERGIEADLTADGDLADNNNIISGFPGTLSTDPEDRKYSPLWKVNKVGVVPEYDDQVDLIDVTGDQDTTMIKTTAVMRDFVDRGLLDEPVLISEEDSVDMANGNDGVTFFNCPSQVPDE